MNTLEENVMLINKHDCYSILYELQEQGQDVTEDLKQIVHENVIPKKVVEELKIRNNPVVNFYLNLNNKAHKIIKELLTCDNENKSIVDFIKVATSLITQGMITVEHLYKDDIAGQNYFIECLGLKELSSGLSDYFNSGDCTNLIKAVHNNKTDVKSILD